MRSMRIFGFVIIIAGIAALLFANYINEQVAQGKVKIDRAEKTVDKTQGLFSGNPVSEGVGKGLTGGAQKKIDAGKDEVAKYEKISSLLQTGGVIAIIVGAGMVVVSFFGRKKGRR